MSNGGKGSAQRPVANRKTFEENWDAIFGDGNRAQQTTEDKPEDVKEKAHDTGRQDLERPS